MEEEGERAVEERVPTRAARSPLLPACGSEASRPSTYPALSSRSARGLGCVDELARERKRLAPLALPSCPSLCLHP
eukprot:scaffold265311_cov33-Tisochrysis_lutea.AAC.4